MANSSELYKALKDSKWGELLNKLVREEHHSTKYEPIDLGVFEEDDVRLDLREEPLVTYLRSQCGGPRPYMVAATGYASDGNTLKISSDFLLHHSEVHVPYITGEQRGFLWEHSIESQPHIYIFTHAHDEERFQLWEMKELVSRAVSTKRDVYFVLVREKDAIAMMYDCLWQEFFRVEVIE